MHASVIRDDDYLTKLLESAENGRKFVHYECRKKYTDKRRLTASAAIPDKKTQKDFGQVNIVNSIGKLNVFCVAVTSEMTVIRIEMRFIWCVLFHYRIRS